MLRQTLAILVDSYREFYSKRMFTVAMGVSILVIALFAGVRATADQVTVFGFGPEILGITVNFSLFKPLIIYKFLFVYLIVGFWLTFGATSLGMFSIASIFPDFMTGGSIDLYLSKPISRLRLFVTKYLAGLAFVVVQMAVFAICCYFILGIRGNLWRKSVFLTIPVVVCYFSYLYSINVFFGVFTRSTLASIILTFIAWFVIWGIQTAEQATYQNMSSDEADILYFENRINDQEIFLNKLKTPVPGATEPVSPRVLSGNEEILVDYRNQRDRALDALNSRKSYHRVFTILVYLLPKTGETAKMLSNQFLDDDEALLMMNTGPGEHHRRNNGNIDPDVLERWKRESEARKDAALEIRNRSAWWVVGTSLAFEGILLSLAAWWFCRREY